MSRIARENLVNYDTNVYHNKIVKFIRYSMSDIFLGNSEETFDFSFEATSGELINQMSDGKIGKIEHIA